MKFTAVQDFTSLTELLRFYSDADEIVFKGHCRFDEAAIAEACHCARQLAHRLQTRFAKCGAEEIAISLGCKILRDGWQVGEGSVVYMAECLFPPKTGEATIRINIDAVRSLAELMSQWAGEVEREWFTQAKISEVAVAHELFHIIERRSSSPMAEMEAHAFARALTGLPFSPLLYHRLLARLAARTKAAGR